MSFQSKLPGHLFPERARSVHDSVGVPFYIFAPDYRHSSGGIRVLHYFCHILNELGEEAYIVNAKAVSPQLRTPQLTFERFKEHFSTGRQPVTIYPEVVSGNPFDTPLIARWLLNVPGHLGKPVNFEPKDIICYYEPWCLPEHMDGHFLHVDPLNHSVFNNEDNPDDGQRTLECYYANKYFLQGNPILDEHRNLISLGQEIRRTPEEIAGILRQAKVLYCYEQSGIINEAQACGCPVLLIRSPYWALPPDDSHHLLPGCAVYGEEQALERARASLAKVVDNHTKLRDESWSTARNFIDQVYLALDDLRRNGKPLANETQELWALDSKARSDALDRFEQLYLSSGIYFRDAETTRRKADNSAEQYKTFLTRTTLQEIDGQVLAERMMTRWKSRPRFNIVIEARAGEENLLADSIDSIATQWYPDWHLTFVTEFPPADPSLAELEQVTWIVRSSNDDAKPLIDQAIAQGPGDWLLLLEPGCTLEAHTLAYFADTINLDPAARLLYCDEDVRSDKGEQIDPRFKPDINIELLRNMYYLGPALAVEKRAFVQAGGWSAEPNAALYDLSLRLLEKQGPRAFVHQQDMLLHTPERSLRPVDADAEQKVLRQHVDRQSLPAQIETGLLSGTQKITYPAQTKPLVSIVIPTRDQPGYLAHCIDSIARQTLYANWEIIVVDHDTQDPDALDYLGELADLPPFTQRVEIVRTDGEFNYARLCNLGAAQAQGDYLLFLDNDTEIIQPSWLDILVGYLQQPGVVAVGPRLSKPDGKLSIVQSGPRALGVGGLAAGMAGGDTTLVDPGYCGRLQVAQDVSALPGSCVMVATSAFRTLNGFDEVGAPLYESVLELCLRLRAQGGRLIWTPWVDVVHHDGISRKRLEGDQGQRARLVDLALNERDSLYTKYLPQLANDPYYHRHLSLNGAFSVEPNAIIDWDCRFHDRLRVLGLPLTSGSGEYRMTAPFRALQKAGLAQANIVHPLAQRTQRVLNPIELARAAPDVLMLQQAIDDTQIAQLKRYRRFCPDIFITYAVDDVLGNLPRKHYLYNFQAREGKSRMREGLGQCDRLIASTEPIAEYCRDMVGDIIVVPNRLEGAVWLGHQSLRGAGKKPRVGWAGAQQHLGDLELIKEVVEALAGEVEWVFMGMCPEFLKPFIAEEHPFVPFKTYPAKLASLNLDLAIAPLEQHLFNEGKSNLRLLEYGVMGWPVVCTDIYPYQTNNAPVKRVPNVAANWIEAIRERIHDLDAAYREGEALRAWVLKHYILEDHAEDWLKAVKPGQAGR